jgi:hypothetical protein
MRAGSEPADAGAAKGLDPVELFQSRSRIRHLSATLQCLGCYEIQEYLIFNRAKRSQPAEPGTLAEAVRHLQGAE